MRVIGTTEVRPPDGIGYCDAIAESFARADRPAAIRQQVETAWIESHFEKGPRIEHDYNRSTEKTCAGDTPAPASKQ